MLFFLPGIFFFVNKQQIRKTNEKVFTKCASCCELLYIFDIQRVGVVVAQPEMWYSVTEQRLTWTFAISLNTKICNQSMQPYQQTCHILWTTRPEVQPEGNQGHNEGKGGTNTWTWITVGAPNHRRGTEKSQQCYKYFLYYSAFASERPQVRTRGRETCFLFQAPQTSLSLSVPQNPKSCRALQSYNSPGDRELSKPSTDSARLVVKIEKKTFSVFGGGVCRWRHKERMF